jgi:hypothetical protein
MKKLPQIRNHAPRISQVQCATNRPLHNIRQQQTNHHKHQQPPVMRPHTRALHFNGNHALKSTKRL